MRDAFAMLPPTDTCLLVLTLDRCGTYSGEKRWKNAQEAYRELGQMSAAMLQRLRRWMKSQGWDPLRNQWVSTTEMHRNGWPHVNLVLSSADLAKWIKTEKNERLADHISEQDAKYVSRELADIVTASGFGLLSTAECAHSTEQALGYICKVAGKQDETIGEIAKLTQLPHAAPPRFRRLRSGKGFLPKRHKSNMTGTLVRRQNSNDGTRDVVPLHNVSERLVRDSEEACATEERVWIAELEAAHRCARQVKQFGLSAVALPPVTHWFRKQRIAGFIPRKACNDNLFGPETILQQCRLE
jgi:hypothetical protein